MKKGEDKSEKQIDTKKEILKEK